MDHFLGIDVGTSGAKVLVIDQAGAVVGSSLIEYPLSTPRALWAEQKPLDWWNATAHAVRGLLAKSDLDPKSIRAIGLSGQMHGSVFLDSANRVLRPAILWCDQRTQSECDWITDQAGGAERLVTLIANPVHTGFTAPKIVWLRNNEPEVYARVAKVLLPKDYIRFMLTGGHVTDVSDASGTALFNVAERRWSDELLGAAQIPRALMPDCVESTEITGTLTKQSADTLGLTAGIPVVGGAGDQAAGAVGCGIVEPGIVSNTIGTSGVVFATCDSPATDPKMRIHTFCHAVPGKWHVMGVQLSSGGSLRWLRDTLYPGASYDEITRDVDGIAPGSEGLIFLPYLTGERAPHADPFARGVFFGLTLRHTRAHMSRAVLEGVVFGLRSIFQVFSELDVPIESVRASGGGAKSAVWLQINADIIGRNHHTLAVNEGPALGAALLAAVGAGAYASVPDACRAAIAIRDEISPRPNVSRRYDRYFKVFEALYPQLKDQFQAISSAVAHDDVDTT